MTPRLPAIRLWLIAGAVLVFLGGMLVAIGRWNRAEADRAFVEAAALAARAPPPPGGVRYWAPVMGAQPETAARVRVDAAEWMRRLPGQSPPIRFPSGAARPPSVNALPAVPQSGSFPPEKPAAAPQ